MDVGMVSLVMEGGVPAEVLRRDVHGGGDLIAMGQEQIAPGARVIVAVADRVIPMEGDDVRPDITRVLLQLLCNGVQIHMLLIAEETVAADAFRPGTGGDVLHVDVRVLRRIPV